MRRGACSVRAPRRFLFERTRVTIHLTTLGDDKRMHAQDNMTTQALSQVEEAALEQPSDRNASWLPRPFARFAGFGLIQCWLLSVCAGSSLYGGELLNGAAVHALMPVALGMAIGSFAVLALTTRIRPLARKRGLGVAAALLAWFGSATMALSAAGVFETWALYAGAVVAGAGASWVSLAWQEYFATQGIRAAMTGMAVASLLGAALFALLELAVPAPASSVLTCLLPLASQLSMRPRAGTRFFAGPGDPLAPRQLLTNISHDYSPRFFLMCALMGCAFGGGCYAAVPETLLGGGALAALLVVALRAAMSLAEASVALVQPRHAMRLFYAAFPLLMVSACFIHADTALGHALGMPVGLAGLALAYSLSWALMVSVSRGMRLPCLGLIASLCATCYLGVFLGHAAIGLWQPDASWLSTFGLLVLGTAMLLFASFNGKVKIVEEAFEAPLQTPLEQKALALAERCGLTPRETEVMQVWLAGHNAAYIEETLHISRSTVKAHLNHVYQKTGASGREDLLGMLEDRR